MLARHCPIRTRARHLQILPARRENANAKRLGNVGNFGTQFSRGEARHDERRFGEPVNKTCHVRLVDRRKRDLDTVEGIVVSRDSRLDLALFFVDAKRGHLAGIGIILAARNSVFVVDARKRIEPATTPPGRPIFVAGHRVSQPKYLTSAL